MQQSEMDFSVFATAAANQARRRNAPPMPDADGLFDAKGVAVICGTARLDPDDEAAMEMLA
ncbi:hypothetical protein SAMN05216338_1001878 [Bradyrhizobium sp. Rc2d]|uniref:hypothetical protein n=1 Tax=Bradyrhizobium sp. Rc2d TaxID=1855321 RepID=UPI0008809FF1|nr:hypothetical protein [Bradyrhizobium sp. Rc2d]SDG60398.1 hypothetical protein SAMN05216338_1001878 [Bradyrhizobium sp. Rc2d]